MKNKKINYDIEMLRGVAIIMVLFQHFPSLYFWSDHSFFNSLSKHLTFWTGVDLFFCISGFVVGKALINKLDESMRQSSERNFVIKEFFIKRAFRLLPTSFLWLSVVLLLSYSFNDSGAFGVYLDNLKQALSIVTYNYNWYVKTVNEAGIPATFAPFWSLNLEEQFYFIFPFFIILCPKKARVPFLLICCGILFFIKRQGYLSFNFRIDAISYGVVLAIISYREGYSKLRDALNKVLRSPILSMTVCISLLILTPTLMWNSDHMVGVIALISFFMIYMASFNSGEINLPNIIRKPMIYIGNRSYGLYIIHTPAIYITQEIFARYFTSHGVMPHGGLYIESAITIVCILIMACLVEINYRWVESPTRKMGAEIVSRMTKARREIQTKSV